MSVATMIRRWEGPLRGLLENPAQRAPGFPIPVVLEPRPRSAGLYRVRLAVCEFLGWSTLLSRYEPLFRSRRVGLSFRMGLLSRMIGRVRLEPGDRNRLSRMSSFRFDERVIEDSEIVIGSARSVPFGTRRLLVRRGHLGDVIRIGSDATIVKRVSVSDRSAVAAKSVVTRDVPPGVVVAGNPARVVKELEGDHG